jgi:hypothetical protein
MLLSGAGTKTVVRIHLSAPKPNAATRASYCLRLIGSIEPCRTVGGTWLLFANPPSAIKERPMQPVEADAIIEPPVISLHHVSEEVGLVFRGFAWLDLARRAGHLSFADC